MTSRSSGVVNLKRHFDKERVIEWVVVYKCPLYCAVSECGSGVSFLNAKRRDLTCQILVFKHQFQ